MGMSTPPPPLTREDPAVPPRRTALDPEPFDPEPPEPEPLDVLDPLLPLEDGADRDGGAERVG
jgi:hypothetical protein